MDRLKFQNCIEDLTRTQKKVLDEILKGNACGEIAKTRKVHPSTISKHLTAICKKFGLGNARGEYFSYRWDLIELFAEYKPEAVNPKFRQGCSVDVEIPEGVVPLDSNFYIERPSVESRCNEITLKPGSLLRVKAPRQMGKTSLITRILAHAADQGAQTVCWDLMELDRNTLDNLETFLKSLCWQVTRQLGLEDQLSKYWKGPVSNNQKCSIYFSEYILPQVENFLVLGIDDVDKVFPYHHTAPDALSLLRIWHQNGNKRQSPWNKLRLVLAHSTEEYAQLDQNHSPFNVGVSIALPEFSLLQLQELSNRHGLTWETRYSDGRTGSHALQSLYKVVGGHPYLVRRAFFELARRNIELEKLLQKASTDEGIYSDHLRRHWTVLNKSSALSEAMKKVVMSPEPQVLNPGVKFQLNSMGVVKLQDNCALPRCQLYRTYFSQTL